MDKYVTHRQNLYAEKQALLPADSTREIELTDTDLEAIYGASGFLGISDLPGWLGLSNPAVSLNPEASANPAVSSNPQGFSNPRAFASFSAS